MKNFMEFFKIREAEQANLNNVESSSHPAYLAAVQAFEMILASNKHQHKAVQFLNEMSDYVPAIKSILQRHGLDKFKEISTDNRAVNNNKNIVTKGLGDFSHDDIAKNNDVVVSNLADSPTNPLD